MSIYLKTNPVGVDIAINNIQLAIANALVWVDYDAYHRAYKNQSPTGIIPEVYKAQTQAKTGEYKEVLLNDNLNASSFFYSPDTITSIDSGNLFNPVLSVVFQVDLPEVTGVKDSRQDEEIKQKIILAINESGEGKVSSIVSGIESVYSEFDTSKIQLDDMQPYLVFRLDIDISYAYSCDVYTEKEISDINGNPVIMF